MCFKLKILLWILFTLHFVSCQIVTVQYYHKNIRKRPFYCYKKGNYLTKDEMLEAILRDYAQVPSCCLYLQEIVIEKHSRYYNKRRYLEPEPISRTREIQKKPCSIKKSCPSKYKIFVLYIGGITYYEVNGLAFRSLYYAQNYVLGKRNRRVRFGNEHSVSFNKKEPPTKVRENNTKFRMRSRSIA
uniref:KTSC domain-containing protein n=1 Tax=Strongyloides papillosus TaxID=174720 RepID=A0A0N5B5C3_STREA